MKKTKLILLLVLCMAFAVLFAACNEGEGDYQTKTETQTMLKTLETALSEKITANEQAIAALKTEYDAKIAALETVGTTLNADLTALTEAYEAKVAALTAADKANTDALAALEAAHAADKAALEQTVADNKSAAEAALKALTDKHAAELAALEQTVADNKAAAEAALKALTDKHDADKQTLLDKIAAAQAEHATLTATYNAAVTELNGKIAANATALAQAKTDFQNALDTLNADYESELGKINDLITALQNADSASAARIAELERQVEALLSAHKHTFGGWVSFHGNENVFCENRLFYRICDTCRVLEWKQGSADDHKITTVTTAPTCQAEGFDTHTCQICGKVEINNYTEKVAHQWQDTYSYDCSYHWYACKHCDARNQVGEHTANRCTVCNALCFTHEITGVQKPDALVQSLGANRNRFTVKTGNYVVGDDNAFTFRLKVTAIDENDEQVTLTSYVSVTSVYLVEGGTKTLVGAEYVTVDENKQTFDFTEAAIGKTFEIVTRPRDIYEEDYQDFTHTLVVDVVNGYNVTDAKELNLMTNAPTEMHELFADRETIRQNHLAAAFVDQHYGEGYYNRYGGDLLKGLVLHCDLSPAPADLPTDYIVTIGDKTGFDDAFTVYDHILKGASDYFNIYGNFFTVNTKCLPLMSNAPELVGTATSSDSDVFGIEDDGSMHSTLEQRQNFDYKIYSSKISNLAMRGFDGTSNDASESGAHMRGLNGWDVLNLDITMDNIIMEAYTISIVPSNNCMRLNILNSKFDNAWQNHIFIWAHNHLQDMDDYHDQEPWNNTRMEINIRNTTMTKCGGPIIMCISDNDKPYNKNAGADITVDAASHLESMVAGTEAWFEAYNGAPFFELTQAQQIKAMSGPIANSASKQDKTASFITTLPNSGDAQFMNMVVAILTGEGSYKLVDADGNVIKTLMDSTSQTVVDYENGALSAAPLFQSVEDPSATAYYLQGQMDTDPSIVYAPNPNAELNNPSTWVTPNIPSALFEGDHIGMYYNGMALLLGYFH